jgi:hypothetical protein
MARGDGISTPVGASREQVALAQETERYIGDRERQPVRLPAFTVAAPGLPNAARWYACMIFVTDEAGGAVPAFSDGTNWRRSTDRAVCS